MTNPTDCVSKQEKQIHVYLKQNTTMPQQKSR